MPSADDGLPPMIVPLNKVRFAGVVPVYKALNWLNTGFHIWRQDQSKLNFSICICCGSDAACGVFEDTMQNGLKANKSSANLKLLKAVCWRDTQTVFVSPEHLFIWQCAASSRKFLPQFV